MALIGVILKAVLGLGPWALSFLGPVGPFLGAIVGFIGQLLKWALEGLTVIVSNPITWVTVAFISIGTFGFGLKYGLHIDRHIIENRNAKIASMQKAQADRDAEESKRAAAAKAAREEAERNAAKRPNAAPAVTNPGGAPSDGVRKRPAPKPKPEPSLWSIFAYPK